VKNEDAKNDVEDIKDIEDIKDDIEDIKDAGADDISDIGEDVEDVISDEDTSNDLDGDGEDVSVDIDTADDISDTGPQNYECLVTTEDLDKNKIDIIYRYYNDNGNPLSCDTPISSISSIKIYVPAGIEQNFEKPPFGMAKKGINICLPKHDSCNTIADEQNRTDENNDYSFSNGVRLQFQLITPYEENKQDPLKLFFVVPRIAAYLKCKNGPIPDPDYTYIDDVLYACRAVGNLPPLGGDMATYYVFANANDIQISTGATFCGPDGKCGKQYRINIEKQTTYLTTIWKGGVIMQEGEPIKIAYPASINFLPNGNGQPVSINNHMWRVTEIIIEKVEKTDNSPAKYILKGIKINKE
jgi:hypothetical protein